MACGAEGGAAAAPSEHSESAVPNDGAGEESNEETIVPQIEPAYLYEASVLEVVDGDTFHLEVDMGFYTRRRILLRLRRVNTPEIFGASSGSEEHRRGMAAKAAAEEFIDGADRLLVTTVHPKNVDEIELKGKYGRWLGDLIDASTGERLSEELAGLEGVEVYE